MSIMFTLIITNGLRMHFPKSRLKLVPHDKIITHGLHIQTVTTSSMVLKTNTDIRGIFEINK